MFRNIDLSSNKKRKRKIILKKAKILPVWFRCQNIPVHEPTKGSFCITPMRGKAITIKILRIEHIAPIHVSTSMAPRIPYRTTIYDPIIVEKNRKKSLFKVAGIYIVQNTDISA